MSHDSGCSVCGERSVHFNCGVDGCPKPGKYMEAPPKRIGDLSPVECKYLADLMDGKHQSRNEAWPAESYEVLRTKLSSGAVSGMVTDFHDMVERFNRDIIGLTVPTQPTQLSPQRKEHALDHMQEELDEFSTSTAIDDEVDAILDLVYVALGRLVEMGVASRPVFEEVHAANMRKHRGAIAKRPNSAGHDAVKPEDWTPPNLTPYLTLGQDMIWAALSWNKRDRNWKVSHAEFSKSLEDRVTLETAIVKIFPWFEHMPQVHRELAELRMKKGQDYNVGGPTIPDYFPFGHKSYAQMVHVKSLRVQSLLAVEDAGRTPNFEGLRDTLMDILNYATFYIEALDRGDLTQDYTDPKETN